MKIEIKALTLTSKNSIDRVVFGEHLTFIHGEMSTGKSTVAGLIDYCFGGKLPATPAVLDELVSVRMEVEFQDRMALFERDVSNESHVQVTCIVSKGEMFNLDVPIPAGEQPVLGNTIFNLSDLMFWLLGQEPVQVRRRTTDPDSTMIRLSFRDIFKFLYLDQDNLDSDFFLLTIPIRQEKSKDTIHYLVGYISERLTELQDRLQEARASQRSKKEAAERIEEFLKKFEFDSVGRIQEEQSNLNDEIELLENRLDISKRSFSARSFIEIDDERAMRRYKTRIKEVDGTIDDLERTLSEHDSLRAELITLKFKLNRADSAREVLAGVKYEHCPQCGTEIIESKGSEEICALCKSEVESHEQRQRRIETYQRDLDDRIVDLDQAIKRHKRSLGRVNTMREELLDSAGALERKLERLTSEYESQFLKATRQNERKIAELGERLRFLGRVRKMPEEVDNVYAEVDKLSGVIRTIQRELEVEELKLTSAERNFKYIEENYKEILLNIGFPGMTSTDLIVINRQTMVPEIWMGGSKTHTTDFFNIGSGGKKTLLKICFALALHKTAAEHNLPLPRLLIIDSPMKNITPDVNKQIFISFYEELYRLMSGPLNNWQVILIDQSYYKPTEASVLVEERLFTKDNPEHPPLISSHQGH